MEQEQSKCDRAREQKQKQRDTSSEESEAKENESKEEARKPSDDCFAIFTAIPPP